MNTLMHRTARFLPRPLVKGLSWISREFSFNNPLLRLKEDLSKQAEDRRAYRLRRWREDETYRQSNMEWTYGWFGRKMEDPYYREARKESLRVAHQQRYQDKQISGRISFRRWLTGSSKKLRKSLVWKTHAPILYEEKVMHTCVDCGYPSRGGLKLWCKYYESVPIDVSNAAGGLA